ncbi:hypothetical protein GG344DRAFT_66963 [Lentinula edodes]|nr:hypothetical protein GG344DRAFT_66963 [Lentinula edodes]
MSQAQQKIRSEMRAAENIVTRPNVAQIVYNLQQIRGSEHEIRPQILADAFKHCGAADQATLKRHFLTPYVCGKVFVNDGVDTTDGIMHQELPTISSDSMFTLGKINKLSLRLKAMTRPLPRKLIPDLSERLLQVANPK